MCWIEDVSYLHWPTPIGFTELLETLLEVCIYSKTQSLVDAQKVCLGIAQRSQSLKLAT